MAFAAQKCSEVRLLADALAENRQAWKNRRANDRTTNEAVRRRTAAITVDMFHRSAPYPIRAKAQRQRLGLPPVPTTTIGSFPQTPDVRQARARFKAGELDAAAYDAFLRQTIAEVVARQEELGLDVLVHGEPERNDMVEYFGEATTVAKPETQIHTHMRYTEFNAIVPAIAAMDADVIGIEASRSRMELLTAFADFQYPNETGPGLYDIHSPRVPSVEEMEALLRRAAEAVAVDRLWANPDCGLKTRNWPETMGALRNMVSAAQRVRETLHA